jgi:hypothetical protein
VHLWFYVWFFLILKIPAAYLAYVIWWAVKDPPEAQGGEAAAGGADEDQGGGPGWRRAPGRRRGRRDRGPHGVPARRPVGAVARRHEETR